MVRYSQVYARPESLLKDSSRFRYRLSVLFDEFSEIGVSIAIAKEIEAECGVSVVQYSTRAYVNWESFFRKAELRDVLDSPTIARSVLLKSRHSFILSKFLSRCAKIFDQEAVGYFLDEEGLIHPKVDAEFERNRISAISTLSGEKYQAARLHVTAVEEALLLEPISGRAAIRAVFDVVENVFKVNFKSTNQLNSKSIQQELTPVVQRIYSRNGSPALPMKQLEGFKSWVDSAHPIRHAGSDEVIQEPPNELVFHMVSLGLSYARWLAAILETDS